MFRWNQHESFSIKSIEKISWGLFTKFHKSSCQKRIIWLSKDFQLQKNRSFKPQSHIHDFGPSRATIQPDLSNCDALAWFIIAP